MHSKILIIIFGALSISSAHAISFQCRWLLHYDTFESGEDFLEVTYLDDQLKVKAFGHLAQEFESLNYTFKSFFQLEKINSQTKTFIEEHEHESWIFELMIPSNFGQEFTAQFRYFHFEQGHVENFIRLNCKTIKKAKH